MKLTTAPAPLDFTSEDAALRSIRATLHELDAPEPEPDTATELDVTRQALLDYLRQRVEPNVNLYDPGLTLKPEDLAESFKHMYRRVNAALSALRKVWQKQAARS